MMERVEGAPTLPVQNDLERDLVEAHQMFQRGDITQEQYYAIRARLMGAAAEEVSGRFRPVEEVVAESQARRAPVTPPTEYPEDGTLPVDPLAGMVGRPGNRAMPPRIAEEQRSADRRQYGARWGGGEPFRSTGEREGYVGRRLMSEAEKSAERARLQSEGVPEEEIETRIIDMQRSQIDRDAAQAGMSASSTGYVPYYVDGREVMGIRAPDPEYQEPRVITPTPTPPRGIFSFVESPPAEAMPEEVPETPIGAPGVTNRVTGGRRTGPRVEQGELTPSLRRDDLERLGYQATTVQGPYGPERVYLPPGVMDPNTGRRVPLQGATRARIAARTGQSADLTDEELREGERQYDSTQRLRVRAGLGPDQDPNASPQRLRQIIAHQRQQDKNNRMANVTKRAMFQTNPIALQGMEDLNDWERLAIDRRMGGGSDTTPIDADRERMLGSYTLAQAALAGGANAETMRAAREMQETQLPPEEAARLSRGRGEPMGSGLSARFVQERWDFWFVRPGLSSPESRLLGFRRSMEEEVGYDREQVDEYLRRNPPPTVSSGPPSGPPPPLAPPGTPPPRGSNPRFR